MEWCAERGSPFLLLVSEHADGERRESATDLGARLRIAPVAGTLRTGTHTKKKIRARASSAVGSAPAGRTLYTQLLNERGGVESDLTIVPQTDATGGGGGGGREFYVVTSSATCTRDADHIARSARLRRIDDVRVEEVADDSEIFIKTAHLGACRRRTPRTRVDPKDT